MGEVMMARIGARIYSRTLLALIASGATSSTSLFAQGSLPDARAVLARYATVSGASRLAGIAGFHITGTFELPGMGIQGKLDAYRDRAGRSYQMLVIDGIGELRAGSDSTFAWRIDPMQGPRIIEGKEFTQQREQEDPRGMRRDTSFVVEAQAVERSTVDGEACIKLKLKWKSGRESTECYSEKTGLLLQTETVTATELGDVPTTRTYNDYKTVDGITMAMLVIERAMGQEQRQRITAVQFGEIDPSKFELPAEIKALRK
jgi:hypothetical protein